MPFRRAVWLQLCHQLPSHLSTNAFQCPLSGQFGCNKNLGLGDGGMNLFQCPLSGQFGCNAKDAAYVGTVDWFQCPLSGQFGCNERNSNGTSGCARFNAL